MQKTFHQYLSFLSLQLTQQGLTFTLSYHKLEKVILAPNENRKGEYNSSIFQR